MLNKGNASSAKRGPQLLEKAEKLPHERDEAPESGAPRPAAIRQAERDVRHGLVDTDNYTRARDITRPVLDEPRRKPR